MRNREEVRRNDGLRHHMRIMRVKDEKDLIENLKALKELGKDDKNKVLLRDGRLLEILIPKITEKNKPVQELSLDIITIMSQNDVKSQVTVRDAQGVPPIIELLKYDDLEIKRRAARCLGAVSQNNRKIQQMARKSKAIQMICEMLSHENEECRKSAACAIASLAENDCLSFFFSSSHLFIFLTVSLFLCFFFLM